MKIRIVTPAPPRSRTGNRVTALRWAKILKSLGHNVHIIESFQRNHADVLIALHARRSADSVERFRERHPDRPLVVALTGTDLYRDIDSDAEAQRSLDLATRLVALQPLGIERLPRAHRAKCVVIHQSVPTPRVPRPMAETHFEVCVIGHLREVKDPFRAALAARRVPERSRLLVSHIGAALDSSMEDRARREEKENPRYHWLGELPRWKARYHLSGCRLLVLTSKMEGGANVISEAIVAGIPVISSRIDGSIGLLGSDYPGFFPVGDEKKLAELVWRAEQDSDYLERLRDWGEQLRPTFHPSREKKAWRELLASLTSLPM